MEDLTEPELIRTNPLCNRTVCLYGYVRGCPLKADTPIHIPGKYVMDSINPNVFTLIQS